MNNTVKTILVALVSSGLAIAGYKYFEDPQVTYIIPPDDISPTYTNFPKRADNSTYTTATPTDFIDAAEKAMPFVVNIKAMQFDGSQWFQSSYAGTSSGSGVIISDDGYIVTNNHVIEDAKDIEISLYDKRSYEAELVGTDPSTDLALIKVTNLDKGDKLPFSEFADSDNVRIGEWVMAVGNPFNLSSTVTAGIVSAKGRDIDILNNNYSIESFIQTDAAVNPGNSGGALVNTKGDLVGINTAIITKSGNYEGYSFAIPSNLVRKVIHDIKEYGTVQRGFLGIGINDLTAQRAERLGLKTLNGVVITRVNKNSAASEAGLQLKDVITSVNGVKTKTIPELLEQVGRYRPGNELKIKYLRDGKEKETKVILKNQYNSTALVEKNQPLLTQLGMELKSLSKEEKGRVGVTGVKVISITRGSKIDQTNMKPGYIITKVNDKIVSTVEDVVNAIENENKRVLLEGVYENYRDEYYYAFSR